MKKQLIALLLVISLAATLFAGCGAAETPAPAAEPTTPAEETTAPAETTEPEATEPAAAEPEATEPEATEPEAVEKEYTRLAAAHTMTSFVDGNGYGKLEEFESSDLYASVAQVSDYPVFYGYSMEGYYGIYPQYFQEFNADGTVATDYFQLLKEAIGSETYAPVDETIEGYLSKISGLYYGAGYEDYWTYFCFIPEDAQEYQQLHDAAGMAKLSGYDQSDLYVSTKSVLSYAYYGYTMSQYYSWYSSYGYFTVDNTDYYALLTTAMNGELYAPVTDEIKGILEKISFAFWGSEEYWDYFCSVKTEIIPEGKFETVTTDYYKALEAECGHDTFVPVTESIKEALMYLSYSFYGDAQYWDYWTYTTYEVTGETKAEGGLDYTPLADASGEYKTLEYADSDLYVNLDVTFEYTWNYGDQGVYTMAQWYSYGGTYAGNFIKTEVVEVTE